MGKCPICGQVYEVGSSKPRRKSKHHVFCRRWYKDSNLLVEVCQKCHDDFHRIYVMNAQRRWSKKECFLYWIQFCVERHVLVYKVYPCLRKYKAGLEL